MPARALSIALVTIFLSLTWVRELPAVESADAPQAVPASRAGDRQVNELKLTAENWDRARHGERLIQITELRELVNEWSSMQAHAIELRYPGGEEGELWVRELMDWLISLGIPSQYLVSVPGSGEADVIKFQIIKTGERYR